MDNTGLILSHSRYGNDVFIGLAVKCEIEDDFVGVRCGKIVADSIHELEDARQNNWEGAAGHNGNWLLASERTLLIGDPK